MEKIYQKFVHSSLIPLTGVFLEILLFAFVFAGFLFLSCSVINDGQNSFDISIFQHISAIINGQNTKLFLFITSLGDYPVLISANVLLAGYFLYVKRNKQYFMWVAIVSLGSVTVMYLLKEIYSRPRPLNPLLDPAIGYSFPSGHSMSGVTFYGLLIYFIWLTGKQTIWKIIWSVCLLIVIILIGISRIYLRVHFASDVIGGYCTGILWLIISIWIARWLDRRNDRGFKSI